MTCASRILWGQHEGRDVYLYTLINRNGTTATITTLGGILVSLTTQDRNGNWADVVLGCDSLKDYEGPHPFFGALVGRYANRIAGAAFMLDGVKVPLTPSEGLNQLHGGKTGFDKKVWDAVIVPCPEGDALALSCWSPDGEEGFPGNLDVTVRYTLTGDNALRISYRARSDKDTVVNLTNHSYFNLAGHDQGQVLDQELQLRASRFTPIGEGSIPTGVLQAVEGTPLDFRTPVAIGARIADKDPQIQMVQGYDHNYVIDRDGLIPAPCAIAHDPVSGRVMTVFTNKPGVQLYTGNFLTGKTVGKGGCLYPQHAGFCLETQHFPDAVNQSNFPSPFLKAGETYAFETTYAFSVRD